MKTSLRRAITLRATQPISTRSFILSTHHRKNDSAKTDAYTDSEHATSKAKHDANDIQSNSVKAGQKAVEAGKGGSATERKDSQGGVAKAKKEHPEAPDPAIGMQDERGGRGG
ncbi:hypothetical protein P154DRAFT_518440 [Amniculicola lignicola CBS 123094]|uniref:Uncharacterized protein n=1 Tax=Amniculicola lignicola CBS 123094 TaxID=1392246 RepID=A0A6A5WVH5_9PLEO|nr:hypothetical protein P154DRAFT_518440 [Amniculicola lignicola CBS 123094]